MILHDVLIVLILAFQVSTMLGFGLSLTVREIVEPLHNVRLVARSLVASYLVVPLIAFGVATAFSLAAPLQIGLILLSMAAGSEAAPKLVAMARGDVAFSVGLLTALLGVTVVYIPLLLTVLVPDVAIERGRLLAKVLVVVLLPMVIGLLLKARQEALADRLAPFMNRASTLLLVLATALIFYVNVGAMARLFGSGALLAAAIFIAASFAAGHLLGGPQRSTRRTLAFLSGTRNASIALMIASEVFADPKVLLMITVTVILMISSLLPAAFVVGRRADAPLQE
jgi:BASS family bile acid:Na+ symporter